MTNIFFSIKSVVFLGGLMFVASANSVLGVEEVTLVKYDFTGQKGDQIETSPTWVIPKVVASPVSRGKAYTQTIKSAVFNANGMGVAVGKSTQDPAFLKAGYTIDDAIKGQGYFEIVVGPENGYVISISSIVLGTRKNKRVDGPNYFAIRSSLDNYTKNLALAQPTVGASNPVLGKEPLYMAVVVSFGVELEKINKPITLRFYGYDRAEDSMSWGFWAIGNPTPSEPFMINGTIGRQ